MNKQSKKMAPIWLAMMFWSVSIATPIYAQTMNPVEATAKKQEVASQARLDALKSRYPNTTINSVRPSHIDGVYEVVMGSNIAYTDVSGRYFLFGHLFDMQQQIDLTAERYSQFGKEAAAQREFPKAHLNNAIKTVKGNGRRVLALFSDPDCPYCKKIESELDHLDNITLYTFLYPLELLHPDAKQKALDVWCAPDKLVAWQALMKKDQTLPTRSCQHPLDENLLLGKQLNISGTPTLIAEDGRVLVGAASAEKIEAWLTQGKEEKAN